MGASKTKGGLGFRNVESFNLVLLAKQGWRMLENPNSIAFHVYRDKYCKQQHLLEAKLGVTPSLIWRSVWERLNLLKEGLRWRVGNGEKIRIWGDRWIPSLTTFSVQSVYKEGEEGERVSGLINIQTKEWKKETVNQMFKEMKLKSFAACQLANWELKTS
ncbi:hypothetical protein I3843_06G055600 [Carya illinoinensis]|nr:hypothetical protein I3843_06G055600 [Carya illinoinensis]